MVSNLHNGKELEDDEEPNRARSKEGRQSVEDKENTKA